MRISETKRQKIKEAILSLLFHSTKALFTAYIARELARDEEFVKELLTELEKQSLVKKIDKNNKGQPYKRRLKWTLTSKTYDAYRQLAG
jgi:Mn-dependent DtxR family transcriptional regulator